MGELFAQRIGRTFLLLLLRLASELSILSCLLIDLLLIGYKILIGLLLDIEFTVNGLPLIANDLLLHVLHLRGDGDLSFYNLVALRAVDRL